MEYNFTITRSEAEVKRIAWLWWRRQYGKDVAMSALCAIPLLVTGWSNVSGMRNIWLTLGAALALVAVLMPAFYLLVRRHFVKRLALIDPPVFQYRFTEEFVAESSAAGRFEVPWRRFTALQENGGFHFLFMGTERGANFIAFPNDSTPADALDFMRRRLALSKIGVPAEQ